MIVKFIVLQFVYLLIGILSLAELCGIILRTGMEELWEWVKSFIVR